MKEEKLMILAMLEEGKITSDEAIKLLEALEENEDIIKYKSTENKKEINIDIDKTKEKISEIEKNIKEQGKKVENFGVDLGNKISNIFNNIVDKSNPVNFMGGYETINTKLEKDISHIKNPIIDFKAINGDINVNKWNEDKLSIKILCKYKNKSFDKDDGFYNFYEEDNKLKFVPVYNNNIMIKLDVFLPDKYYDQIKLQTSNGQIQIKDFKLDKLLCNTNNAPISLKNISTENIDLSTKNGRINLTHVSSPFIKAISTNSNIVVEDINSRDLTLSTINGRLVLSKVLSNDIHSKTSNGSIEINNISSEKIKLKTSNGKILGKNIDFKEVKELILSTSNANIDVETNNIDKMSYFDLETSLGSINLEIPDLIYKVNKQISLGTRKVIAHSVNFNRETEHFILEASTSNGSINIE